LSELTNLVDSFLKTAKGKKAVDLESEVQKFDSDYRKIKQSYGPGGVPGDNPQGYRRPEMIQNLKEFRKQSKVRK
jgi:hypothetical protein